MQAVSGGTAKGTGREILVVHLLPANAVHCGPQQAHVPKVPGGWHLRWVRADWSGWVHLGRHGRHLPPAIVPRGLHTHTRQQLQLPDGHQQRRVQGRTRAGSLLPLPRIPRARKIFSAAGHLPRTARQSHRGHRHGDPVPPLSVWGKLRVRRQLGGALAGVLDNQNSQSGRRRKPDNVQVPARSLHREQRVHRGPRGLCVRCVPRKLHPLRDKVYSLWVR